MTKINKKGFTLSEALITLSVIGTLALLVLPGIIKDTTNKASIALLGKLGFRYMEDTVVSGSRMQRYVYSF